MNKRNSNFDLSNPFSTGEGGVTFEQLVGTSYLVSLLAGDVPRGLDWGITKSVQFQCRWSNCLLDDVVITSTDGYGEKKLALQVKHDLTFSDAASNNTFAHVIDDCWKTFDSSLGWAFNQEKDRIGVGLGIYQNKIDKHFRPLLEWARTSLDSSEFLRKVSLPAFSSKEKQEYLQIIKSLLSKSKESNITDDEIWKFLRCLVVIHFDVENAGSSDAVHCWNRLLDRIKNRDAGQAKLLFSELNSIVAEYSRSAGAIDAKSLRAKIPSSIQLEDQPNYVSDLTNLREHTNRVLVSINDTIGNKVQLPKNETLDQLETHIKRKDIIVITGEPMVGKSVILKLLANRLRLEGQVLAFSVERFSGTTLESFLHNIHIKNDFGNILFAVGTAPLRCILIDQLEKVSGDEKKRRILDDLIIKVREYNEDILSRRGNQDYCWKIVITCRNLEATNILSHLETRKNFIEKALEIVEIKSLKSTEITEVVTQLPKLQNLATQEYLKGILCLPLVLDILTLPDVSLPSDAVPSTYTESWLLEWFWKEVVRLADKLRPGRGHPDKREQLLIDIAMQSVKGNRFILISNDMDPEAIDGLVSDRLLLREDNHLRFAHDILEDWAMTVMLRNHKDNIITFLKQFDETLRLIRPFRLYASGILEVKQAPNVWLNLLDALEQNDQNLSPCWHQTALTAPLFSPLLEETLSQIEKKLFDNECALLIKLLNALRTICVQPDPKIHNIFAELPQHILDKYMAYFVVPIKKQWIPVIQFVLKNIDKLNDKCWLEFSYIAEKWMKNTSGQGLYREKIAEQSVNLLNRRFLITNFHSVLKSPLEFEEQEHLRRNLVTSVLWAADCAQNIVDDFIQHNALRNREEENYGFEEVILEEGWQPICKYLPKTALVILETILCAEITEDKFGGYYNLAMNLGIKHTLWNPPTYFKGPFLGFLRSHEDYGLALIHKITNHATQCWRIIEESHWKKKPIPQNIRFANKEIRVYGNDNVYNWYRYPTTAPDAVTCALMALEYWMNEKIKNGYEARKLFEEVMQNTESVAIVGVCSSVALANMNLCYEAIIPVLENPAFWEMDIRRLMHDLTAENSINMLSRISVTLNKGDFEALRNLAKQSHRKCDIRSFILPIILGKHKSTRKRLQDAMRRFPNNPPFFFEDEKESHVLVEKMIRTCKLWAACAEPENYEFFKTGIKGQLGVQFKLPTELEAQQVKESAYLDEQEKFVALEVWSMNLLDKGEIGKRFTIESAMQYAQELSQLDDTSYIPKYFLEDFERRANIIAAFAAALIKHQWQWVEDNNYLLWCRKQLLIAANRPEPPETLLDETSPFNMGYRRSAARALPIFLSKKNKDKEIRKAIWKLSRHTNFEVRAYLFDALKTLWLIDQRIIWRCIRSLIKKARKKAIDSKFWYLKKQPNASVDWGKHASLKKTRKKISKNIQLFLLSIYSKPIKTCSSIDIKPSHLESILYSFPSDVQISKITPIKTFIDFIKSLLCFTINSYIYYERKERYHRRWVYSNFNSIFFPIIANAILYLPENITRQNIYDPFRNNWENAPSMLEVFLRYLRSFNTQPDLEDKYIELWLDIGNQVLSSNYVKCATYQIKNIWINVLNILLLGLPDFTDSKRMLKWSLEDWKTYNKLVEFVNHWCNAVGHHPDCFPSLVKFLSTIGFTLLPEHGVGWFYSCITKVKDHKQFFKRSKVASSFADFLYDSWSIQEQSIRENPKIFKHFAYLVDKLAEQGERLAIQLQSKLQDTTSDK